MKTTCQELGRAGARIIDILVCQHYENTPSRSHAVAPEDWYSRPERH